MKSVFGDLNIDSDKALLLSLILLLSEEKADELLIMALIYMLTWNKREEEFIVPIAVYQIRRKKSIVLAAFFVKNKIFLPLLPKYLPKILYLSGNQCQKKGGESTARAKEIKI